MHSVCSVHPLDQVLPHCIFQAYIDYKIGLVSRWTYTILFHLSFCNFNLKVTCTEEVPNPYNITKTFILNVVDVNEAPGGINITSNTVAENLDPGSVVGRVYAVDPDNEVFL